MGDKFDFEAKAKLPKIQLPAPGKRPGAMPLPQQITVVSESSPIGRRWVEEGRKDGPLGESTGMEHDVGDGCRAQTFAGGVFVWSATYGVCRLSKRLFPIWLSEVAIAGPPTADEGPAGAGAQVLRCEKGGIYNRGGTDVFFVHGESWVRHVGLRAHESPLGLPRSNAILLAGGGLRWDFDGGAIVWSAATGAHEARGGIGALWDGLGGPTSWLGLPMTGETPIYRSGTTGDAGAQQLFQNGSIVWSPANGAAAMRMSIFLSWLTEHRGVNGAYGLPVAGERQSPGGTAWVDFEGGVIFERKDRRPEALQSVDFFVESFRGWGDDGPAGGAQELYVHAQVDEHRDGALVQSYSERLPGGGTWEYGNGRVDRVVLKVQPLRGASVLTWRFEGRDYDWNGADDTLGVLSGSAGIDDDWALAVTGEARNGTFGGHLFTRAPGAADPNEFRRDFFWRFQNFGTPELTWTQYAQTFADVRQVGSESLSPGQIADAMFFETKYEGCAKDGNCFGMCLEAVYAHHNRSRYALPLDRFGPPAATKPQPGVDHEIIYAINIRHGYQYGESAIQWLFNYYVMRYHNNATFAFDLSKGLFESGDDPLIAVATDQLFESGHIVRPYKWDKSSVPWKLYVANPNTPAPAWPDDHDSNVIRIWPNGVWEMGAVGGTVWRGDTTGTKGRIVVYPYNVVSRQPTVPGLTALLQLIGMWFIGTVGAAETVQVTDASGKRLFRQDLAARPRWEDLAPEGERIPDMFPLPTWGAPDGPADKRPRLKIGKVPVKETLNKEIPNELIKEAKGKEVFQEEIPNELIKEAKSKDALNKGAVTKDVPSEFIKEAKSNDVIGKDVIHEEVPREIIKELGDKGVGKDLVREEIVTAMKPPSANGELYMRCGRGPLTHRLALHNGDAAWSCEAPGLSAQVRYTGNNHGIDELTVHHGADEAPGLSLRTEKPRTVDVELIAAASGRGFRLRGLGVPAGSALSARVGDGGRVLTVDHPSAEVAFDLDVRIGGEWVPNAARSDLRAAAGERLEIRLGPGAPDPWTAGPTVRAPLEAMFRDRVTGTLLRRIAL